MSQPELTGNTAQELVNELADSKGSAEEHPGWHKHVSLTIMILALLSALVAVLSSMTAHQALIERTEEIIALSILESDLLYVETLKSKHEVLAALGESADRDEVEEIEAFEEEVREMERQTDIEEVLVVSSINTNRILAVTVALLSVGTALCGMSMIANRKYLWTAGIVFGLLGAIGLAAGILFMNL